MTKLRDVDRVFSTYLHDSWVSRLGRDEVTLDACPLEVAEVLSIAEQARLGSGGAFDIRFGGGFVPSGVVKGWAAERAARPLRHLPETDVCLSMGGDVICHTADLAGTAWRIGVEDPHDPSRAVAVVPVRRGAVATSGLAHRGAHVVDARTGRAPRQVCSVTVVADELTVADVDATSALAQDEDAGRWLQTRPGVAGLIVWGDRRTELVSPSAAMC